MTETGKTETEAIFYSGAVKFHNDLMPLMEDIDAVHQHPSNYNNGDVEAISESIEVNGVYRPLFVQKSSNAIIAGNHTWEALKILGSEGVPVVYLDVNDEEAYRIMVADNRTAALAQPDSMALFDILSKLDAQAGGLQGTGYRQQDLDILEHLAEIPVENDEFGQWATECFQCPPHVWRAFKQITREASDNRDKMELLLRLAGWDGSS
jgi:hypothetical protein